ncbi:MAG: hypothetical protein ACK47B_10845 [Armatimonadota bacterium]
MSAETAARAHRPRPESDQQPARSRKEFLAAPGRNHNPHTGMPLRPGQRLPTEGEEQESFDDWLYHRRSAPFPDDGRWEITERHAYRWLSHRFEGLLDNPRRAAGLTRQGVDANDLLLLILDLHAYAALRERAWQAGLPTPCLVEYLRADRERWGWWEKVFRLVRAMNRDEDPAVIDALREDLRAAGGNPDADDEGEGNEGGL